MLFLEASLKRLLDLTVAITCLIVLSPVLIMVAIAIRWTMGSPLLFWQERPGYREIPFWMVKFRTMSEERNDRGDLLGDGIRLTKLGCFLRATSLDELPALWNILRGDLSLVGPRPLLMRYLPFYSERERKRHSVRPGMTGLAQVRGRNHLGWEDRLALDVGYVESWSLWLDIRILVKTISCVLVRRGVEVDTSQAMLDLDELRRQRTAEELDVSRTSREAA